MSLATDLTQCQARLAEAGQKASSEMRKLKACAPPEIYAELQLQLCVVAAEAGSLKILLGTLRMIGEMDQRPPEVTAESLELAACMPAARTTVPAFPDHEVEPPGEAFRRALRAANDHTLDGEGEA